jgi:aspartate/glutamate racemase
MIISHVYLIKSSASTGDINMNKYTLAFLMAFLPTMASAFSGADLLSQCKNFVQIIDGGKTDLQHTLQAGLCGGYVLGVQEGFIASSELASIVSEEKGTAPVTGNYWIVPEDVEAENIVRIVVKYLEKNPEMQSKPAVLSVINALIQTYPADADD